VLLAAGTIEPAPSTTPVQQASNTSTPDQAAPVLLAANTIMDDDDNADLDDDDDDVTDVTGRGVDLADAPSSSTGAPSSSTPPVQADVRPTSPSTSPVLLAAGTIEPAPSTTPVQQASSNSTPDQAAAKLLLEMGEKGVVDGKTARMSRPKGLSGPQCVTAGTRVSLFGCSLLLDLQSRWLQKPPTKTGGLYWAKMKGVWDGSNIPSALATKFTFLRDNVLRCQKAACLGKKLVGQELVALSVMWTNGVDPVWHIDDHRTCPDSLLAISAGHLASDGMDAEDRKYVMHFRDSDVPTSEYTMEVFDGFMYALEGPALKSYEHKAVLSERGQEHGKIVIRLGFSKPMTDLARELQCHDEYLAKKAKADRQAAVLHNAMQKEVLGKKRSPRKHAGTPGNNAAEEEDRPKDTTDDGRGSSSGSGIDLTGTGSSNDSSSGITEGYNYPRSSEVSAYDVYGQVDLAHLANMASKAEYYLKGTRFNKSAKERNLMVADIRSTRLLHFGPEWGTGLMTEARGYLPKGPQGTIMGGQFFCSKNGTRKYTMFLWKLMQAHPQAMSPWGHDTESDKYIKKIVIHVEGHESSTKPMPSLQGISEIDRGARAGGESLTTLRRKNVIVFDTKHKTEYLAGDKKKPAKLRGKMSSCTGLGLMEDLIRNARSKFPPEQKHIADDLLDITVLVSGTNTPDHSDEWGGDGSADKVMNAGMNGDGLFAIACEEPTDLDFQAIYVGTNQYSMFTDGFRYAATHQVLRYQKAPVQLDMSLERPPPAYRMVITFRFGPCTKAGKDEWERLYRESYDTLLAKNELALQAEENHLAMHAKNAEVARLKKQVKEAEKSKKAEVTVKKEPPANKAPARSTAKLTRGGGKMVVHVPKHPPSPPTIISSDDSAEGDNKNNDSGDDDSDDVASDDEKKRTTYAYAGSKKAIKQREGCNTAYLVKSLRFKKALQPVVEKGTVFAMRSAKGTTTYMVVRTGLAYLGTREREGRKESEERCFMAWLIWREEGDDKWSTTMRHVEVFWLLGPHGYALPKFSKASSTAKKAGEVAWHLYAEKCLDEPVRKPPTSLRKLFLSDNNVGVHVTQDIPAPKAPAPSLASNTALNSRDQKATTPQGFDSLGATTVARQQGSDDTNRPVFAPEHTIYNDIMNDNPDNFCMKMTMAALGMQGEKIARYTHMHTHWPQHTITRT
jgi:hypothetical protein